MAISRDVESEGPKACEDAVSPPHGEPRRGARAISGPRRDAGGWATLWLQCCDRREVQSRLTPWLTSDGSGKSIKCTVTITPGKDADMRAGLHFQIAIAFALCSGPASAAWHVSRSVDPMTDKSSAVATVAASNLPAIGIRLTCRGPEMTFPVVVTYGDRIGLNFRFDDGPVTPRFVVMSSDRKAAILWLSNVATLSTIARAKRLRVSIFLTGAPAAFVDCDLTGAAAAVRALGCH